MPRSSHPSWLERSNYTWRRVRVMKLVIMQFSPTSCHFVPLWSKYSPQHLSLCSSLNVKYQVSHPHKTIHATIFIVFTCFGQLPFSGGISSTCSGTAITKFVIYSWNI
jgi:hypothetical protein